MYISKYHIKENYNSTLHREIHVQLTMVNLEPILSLSPCINPLCTGQSSKLADSSASDTGEMWVICNI